MIDWLGEALDTLFSLSSKGARWFNIKKMRVCFIIWSICAIYWIYRDLSLNLYSQAFFCVPSLALHIYGWWSWSRKKVDDRWADYLIIRRALTNEFRFKDDKRLGDIHIDALAHDIVKELRGKR
jgi:nicotinamide riboside transporter PnuC